LRHLQATADSNRIQEKERKKKWVRPATNVYMIRGHTKCIFSPKIISFTLQKLPQLMMTKCWAWQWPNVGPGSSKTDKMHTFLSHGSISTVPVISSCVSTSWGVYRDPHRQSCTRMRSYAWPRDPRRLHDQWWTENAYGHYRKDSAIPVREEPIRNSCPLCIDLARRMENYLLYILLKYDI
jgi:hypothetical protein